MNIRDLPTPSLLIEQSRLESNIERMQARADDNRVALRPHVKTHKSIALASRQRNAGARGITVAKPSEAAVFVNEGFDDVRIAYPMISSHQLDEVCSLTDRARLSFCVDTMEGATLASNHFAERGRVAEVLIEVDAGYGRCGLPDDDDGSVQLAKEIADLPGLNVIGILTHAGHAYGGPTDDESVDGRISRISAEERDRMLSFATKLYQSGASLPNREDFEISIGSTPSISKFSNRSVEGFTVTEIRPGNYIFNDAIQVALGVARTT